MCYYLFLFIIGIQFLSTKIYVAGFGSEFICGKIPGLTQKQRKICENAPDSIAAIGEGINLGRTECQNQFKSSRWNCSVMDTASSVGHIVLPASPEAAFLYAISSAGVTYSIARACSRGYISTCGCSPPRTISTAANVDAVGRNYESNLIPTPTSSHQQQFPDDELNTISRWRWGGCSIDIHFATKLARIFLDSREIEKDARSYMNLHNNKAGRKAVQKTLETQCKCHGLSGSCTLKTCWLKLASFKLIGDKLMEKYHQAQHVIAVKSHYNSSTKKSKRNGQLRPNSDQEVQLFIKSSKSSSSSNIHKNIYKVQKRKQIRRSLNEFPPSNYRKRRKKLRKRPKHFSLVYLEKSPTYCERDELKGILGTKNRECVRTFYNRDSPSSSVKLNGTFNIPSAILNTRTNNVVAVANQGTCEILCCGRGYSTHEILKKWKCNCKFTWCCSVECNECEQNVEIYTCN